MVSHETIEERSLALARAVADRIDHDPRRRALDEARERCRRWIKNQPGTDLLAWSEVLKQPWPIVRNALLDTSERGRRLRQSNPFCGVLTARERWAVYKGFRQHDKTPA